MKKRGQPKKTVPAPKPYLYDSPLIKRQLRGERVDASVFGLVAHKGAELHEQLHRGLEVLLRLHVGLHLGNEVGLEDRVRIGVRIWGGIGLRYG